MSDVMTRYLSRRFYLPEDISELILSPLTLLSLGFKPITEIRNYLYDAEVLSSKSLSTPVISVGNLTVGGTGKTPVVRWLANFFESLNMKTTILSRGYIPFSGAIKIPNMVDPTRPCAARRYGDEPVLLAERSKASVVVCRNRFLAGRFSERDLKPDVIILDDGFQHRALKRSLDIIVIDASKPIEKYLIPRGRLRESWRSLSRGGLIILTKTNLTSPKREDEWRAHVRKWNESAPIVNAEYKFDFGKSMTATYLKGEKIFVVAALADPASISRMLLNLGSHVVGHRLFPDHFGYSQRIVDDCERDSAAAGASYIVTTEKDGVKLREYKRGEEWVELPLRIDMDKDLIGNLLKRYGIICGIN